MRTEKVKLFGTHFFCVLKKRNFQHTYNYLIFNRLNIANSKIVLTFAMSKGQVVIEKLKGKWLIPFSN